MDSETDAFGEGLVRIAQTKAWWFAQVATGGLISASWDLASALSLK
jgi:hypothetical protein